MQAHNICNIVNWSVFLFSGAFYCYYSSVAYTALEMHLLTFGLQTSDKEL